MFTVLGRNRKGCTGDFCFGSADPGDRVPPCHSVYSPAAAYAERGGRVNWTCLLAGDIETSRAGNVSNGYNSHFTFWAMIKRCNVPAGKAKQI